MNPLNQCTCTMKWPHKVLLPHAALRVLYVVVKYWFISFFEFRCKGNARLNNFQINIHNLFCEKTLQYMEAPVKTLFLQEHRGNTRVPLFRNIVLKRKET